MSRKATKKNGKKKSKSKFRWKRDKFDWNGSPSYVMSVHLPMLKSYEAFVYTDNDWDENPKGRWEWSVSSMIASSSSPFDFGTDEHLLGEGTARIKEEAMLKCETSILKDIDKRIEQLQKWRKSK